MTTRTLDSLEQLVIKLLLNGYPKANQLQTLIEESTRISTEADDAQNDLTVLAGSVETLKLSLKTLIAQPPPNADALIAELNNQAGILLAKQLAMFGRYRTIQKELNTATMRITVLLDSIGDELKES